MAGRRRDLLKIFLLPGKKRGVEKSMRSVQRLKDGPIVTGTGDMLRETRQFYVDLYTEEGVEVVMYYTTAHSSLKSDL